MCVGQRTTKWIRSSEDQSPLFRVLVVSTSKNDGVLKWHTNVIYHWRIDGTAGDDRNMVGLRLDEIICDEAVFTVWACHSSRKQSALPGCEWLYTGVPNSVRIRCFTCNPVDFRPEATGLVAPSRLDIKSR